MAKWKIDHDRPNCIGCAACAAVAPEFWEMKEDGKSSVINAQTDDRGWEVLEIEEKDVEKNKEAAESCPVNVIHLTNQETNEKVI